MCLRVSIDIVIMNLFFLFNDFDYFFDPIIFSITLNHLAIKQHVKVDFCLYYTMHMLYCTLKCKLYTICSPSLINIILYSNCRYKNEFYSTNYYLYCSRTVYLPKINSLCTWVHYHGASGVQNSGFCFELICCLNNIDFCPFYHVT